MQRSTHFSLELVFWLGLTLGSISFALSACGRENSAVAVTAHSLVIATALPTSVSLAAPVVIEKVTPAWAEQTAVQAVLAAAQKQPYLHFTGTLSRDLKLYTFDAHYAAPSRFHLRMGETEFVQVDGVFYVPVGEQWIEAPEWQLPALETVVRDWLNFTPDIIHAQLLGFMAVDGIQTQLYEYIVRSKSGENDQGQQQVKLWVRLADNLPIKRELRYVVDDTEIFTLQTIDYEPAKVLPTIHTLIDTPIAQGRLAGAWREFSSSAGRFTLLLPGSPQEGEQTLATVGGPIHLQRFEVALGTGIYRVAYGDYPTNRLEQSGTEELLLSIQASIIADVNGTLVSEEGYTVGEYPGRAARIAVAEGETLIRMRIILVGNRLYQILAVGAPENITHSTTDQFLDSFRLLE